MATHVLRRVKQHRQVPNGSSKLRLRRCSSAAGLAAAACGRSIPVRRDVGTFRSAARTPSAAPWDQGLAGCAGTGSGPDPRQW